MKNSPHGASPEGGSTGLERTQDQLEIALREGDESSSISQIAPASKSADLDAEPSGLAGLLARVEAATGGDRELDRDIAVWEYPTLADLPRAHHGGWVHPEYGAIAPPSAYTASLDAALALCERVLPGFRVILVNRGHGAGCDLFAPPSQSITARALGENMPLCILAAMLKALVAPQGGRA